MVGSEKAWAIPQREQAGRGNHARLAHAAAQHLAQPPAARNQRGWARQYRPYWRAQGLHMTPNASSEDLSLDDTDDAHSAQAAATSATTRQPFKRVY